MNNISVPYKLVSKEQKIKYKYKLRPCGPHKYPIYCSFSRLQLFRLQVIHQTFFVWLQCRPNRFIITIYIGMLHSKKILKEPRLISIQKIHFEQC